MIKKILRFFCCLPILLTMMYLAGCTNNSDSSIGGNTNPSSFDSANTGSLAPTEDSNLWSALRVDFKIPASVQDQPAVQQEITWYTQHPQYVTQMAENASPYLYYVYQQVVARQLPTTLVLLPFIESGYNPCLYSDVGAAGLWQLMPTTGSGFGVKEDFYYDGRRDIIASTNAALDYLTYLNNYFGGDWLLALAAYNAGEGTVEAAIHKNEALGRPTDFWDLDLPEETKLYVPRLVALAVIIGNPQRYHLPLPFIPNSPYLSEIDINSQMNLEEVAKLSDMSVNQLYQLNPGYRRGTTDPNGSHRILMPIENVNTFDEHFASNSTTATVTHRTAIYYTVESGDTLSSIAHRFHTSVSAIQQNNGLHDSNLRVGQRLLINTTGRDQNIPTMNINKYCLTYTKHDATGPRAIIYHVQPGDTLWGIANKYQVTPSQIRNWNHLSGSSLLMPGLPLTIYTSKQPEHSTLITPQSLSKQGGIQEVAPRRASPAPRVAWVSYTVQPGDTLSSIAREFNVSIQQIVSWNQLSPDQVLHVGEKLNVEVRG